MTSIAEEDLGSAYGFAAVIRVIPGISATHTASSNGSG